MTTSTPAPPRAERECLEQVFPEPRFPSGVAAAPAALLAVLLVGAGMLVGLRSAGATTDASAWLPGPAGWPGLLPGLAVASVAVVVALLLRVLLVVPVRQLRADVAGGTTAAGGAVRVPRPLSVLAAREVEQVAAALRATMGAAAGTGDTGGRGRVPLRLALPLIAVLVLGALAGSFAVLTEATTTPAADRLSALRQTTAAAAADVRHELQHGLAGLQGAAHVASSDPVQLELAAARALAARPVFGSVSVLNRGGAVVAAAGRSPEPILGAVPAAGISQLNTAGPMPIVVAAVPLSDGVHTLLGEYDVRALNAELRAGGVRVAVLDAGRRTVLSSDGYQAFTELTDPAVAEAVVTARAGGQAAATAGTGGAETGVVAHKVGFDDAAAGLDWVAVQTAPLRSGGLQAASLTGEPLDRAALVVVGLTGGLAVLVLGWIHVVAVRPLRLLGAHTKAVAAARTGTGAGTPEPLAPQRVDEIGAITAGVNRYLLTAKAQPESSTVPVRSAPRPSPRPRASGTPTAAGVDAPTVRAAATLDAPTVPAVTFDGPTVRTPAVGAPRPAPLARTGG